MRVLDKINPLELGKRLRNARMAAQVTQEKAAKVLEFARTNIVAIERGERKVKPEELLQLAKLYEIPINKILHEPTVEIEFSPQFRQTNSLKKEEKAALKVRQILQDMAISYVELEQMLGKPLNPSYPPEYRILPGDLAEQAEDLALEVRGRLGIGIAPIPDVLGLVELEFGLRLFIRELPSSISGVFAYHPNAGACILINILHPRRRQVYTVIHEIAHFLTDRHHLSVEGKGFQGQNQSERFADLFASSFLMPAVSVRKRFREVSDSDNRFTPKNLIYMSRVFHVSLEAITRRLQGLKLLPDGTYESLRERGLNQEFERSILGEEEEHYSPRLPRFTLLAAEAYEKGFLTETQLTEMLCLNRIEVREIIDTLEYMDEEVKIDA